ncbi:MAG: RNA polymerase sigma-I factor [Clostridia bacterium]|nr:RNA polymerase sigma-I factor [Clostridia bacterium]
MFKLKLFNKVRYNDDSIDDVILKITSGDRKLRDLFIKDYRQFIIAVIYSATGKFVDEKNGDELSIGLLAFNEAIDCYRPERNKSFFSFAEQVIRRRMIDFFRQNQKHNHVYPFTYFENSPDENFEENYLFSDASNPMENIETREELLSFRRNLLEFGITIEDLILNGPKHRDAVQSCIRIAKLIAGTPHLFEKLSRKKNLPMSDLINIIQVHERTVQRNRKFIIAVTLILKSQLSLLKEYVRKAEGRGTSNA